MKALCDFTARVNIAAAFR